MLNDAVLLDAAMPAAQAIRRLAQHGYWLEPLDGEARRCLESYAESLRKVANGRAIDDGADFSVDGIAKMLARPFRHARVAIRRQHFTTIFWYARPVDYVLEMLSKVPLDVGVIDALNLHEYTSDRSAQVTEIDPNAIDSFSGVLLNGQIPIGIADPIQKMASATRGEHLTRSGTAGPPTGAFPSGALPAAAEPEAADDDAILGFDHLGAGAGAGGGASAMAPRPPVTITAFPRLDAPRTVVVAAPFDFTVGLSPNAMPNLPTTGPMTFATPARAAVIDAEVHIIADGFDIDGGWRRPFPIKVAEPMKAELTVTLTPKSQDDDVRLTSITVQYLLDGVARGSASFHIAIERQPGMAAVPADSRGVPWSGSELPPPPMALGAAVQVPDIEIDIAKPDGNAPKGTYRCVIRTSHGVPVPDESFEINLGEDAATFAKGLIDKVRLYSSHTIVDNLLENIGALVAEKLPPALWPTLQAVSKIVQGRTVTLQLNSAEPYVPWELALVDPPLDPARPKYLAAQVAMGRWILGDSAVASPPANSITVRAMAIMAGMYNATTGLRPLPKALEEAAELTTAYRSLPAVPLKSTLDDFQSLLNASLMHDFKPIGGAEAVHVVGHGEVDPSRPGDAALYLSTGQPLSPLFFHRCTIGKQNKPFIFLNACMVGTGGELLGEFGGFPGACLHGGFTGLVAPLWAVNDDVAKSFALEFYKQALVSGQTGKPVADVLRDLRNNYKSAAPVPSYLAYVYYGNPFLTMATA